MSVPTLIPTSTVQNLAYTGTAATSTAISANEGPGRTCTIRLVATSDCFYLATIAGTAATTSNGTLLPSGVIEYIRVGNLIKVSVVQSTASGTLNLTQMADVTTP